MDNEQIKKEAILAFNQTWDLIEKTNRTAEDSLSMIDLAFKSKYYWSIVGKDLNLVRSDWQVSRVFAEAKLLEASLFYAQKCLADTLKFNLKDFDLFFAYEANVRVYKLLGQFEKTANFSSLARESIELIKKKDDRDYCLNELNRILEQ